MTDDEMREKLLGAQTALNWLIYRDASEKVRYTWAGFAAERLTEVRDEIGERLPKSRIKIDDLPIQEEQ